MINFVDFPKNGSITTIVDEQVFMNSAGKLIDLDIDLDEAFASHRDLYVRCNYRRGCLRTEAFVNLRTIVNSKIFDGRGGEHIFSSLQQLLQELRNVNLKALVRFRRRPDNTVSVWNAFTVC